MNHLIKQLQKENAQLFAENQELKRKVELLTAGITELEEKLALYQKTSTLEKKPLNFIKQNSHYRKKPGQPKGHKGTSWFRPKEADETVDLTLSCCPNCSHPLLKPFGIRDHFVEELVPASVVVTNYRHYRYRCPSCKKIVESSAPLEIPNARLGPKALLTAAYLKYGLSLPYRKVTLALSNLCGLQVTPGGLAQAIQRSAHFFQTEISFIKESLRKSNFVHSDETGWRLGYRNHWLWVFTTDKVTLYQINKSRSHKVVKKILGKNYKGTLISDFYTAYNPLPYKKQKCLAHLFRELAECKTKAEEFLSFRKKLSRLLHDGMRLAHRREELEKDLFLRKQKHIESRLMQIISTFYQDPDCQRLSNRLRKHKEAIFCFLREADVEPTNNRAERALRQNVISRKVSFGNYSTSGATTQTIITSLIETCRQQKKDFIQYGLEFIQHHLSGNTTSLLTPTFPIRSP